MTSTLLRPEIAYAGTLTFAGGGAPDVVARPGYGARTRAVRAGIATDAQYGAVVPPLHLSSTFSFAGFGQKREYDYTRSGNPTRSLLAETLAE